MTGAFVRFAGWLLLAYFAAKIITAYYLFLFTGSSVTSVLSALPALSPWDALILLLAMGSLGRSAWGSRLAAWTNRTYGSLVVRTGTNGVGQAVRQPLAVDLWRTELRALAVRCRSELVGPAAVDFGSLHRNADRLRGRLVGTELELQIAPLLTNLQQCAENSDQISRTDEAARELRDQGLHHRAHREDTAALEDRVRLNGYREQVLRTADIIVRTTGPLLDRRPQS